MAILKEAHGGGNYNHSEEIKKCGGLLRVGGTANQSTHYRMVEWIYGIESALNGVEVQVEKDRSEGYPAAKKSMLRSAWINVKKANGNAASNWGDLHAVAKRDAKFIRRQFELIAPRVVLCCGTFHLIRDILFPHAIKVEGAKCSYRDQDILVFELRHPARASRDSYKDLIDEAQRLSTTDGAIPHIVVPAL